jgi:hypothetical protein
MDPLTAGAIALATLLLNKSAEKAFLCKLYNSVSEYQELIIPILFSTVKI